MGSGPSHIIYPLLPLQERYWDYDNNEIMTTMGLTQGSM
jgi:hypothetical protein